LRRAGLERASERHARRRSDVPVQASIFDLATLQHLAELVESAQASNPKLRAFVFLSRAPTNQNSEEKAALEALKKALPDSIGVLQTVIHDRRSFRDAAKSGKCIFEWTDVKAIAEFQAFATEILECAAAETVAA
jgi:chromosome partitioning protein